MEWWIEIVAMKLAASKKLLSEIKGGDIEEGGENIELRPAYAVAERKAEGYSELDQQDQV